MTRTVADLLVGVPEQIGVRHNGPTMIDCVAVADERPNFPHLDLGRAGRHAPAKIKEATLAVTGP